MLEGTTPIDTPKHNFKNFDEARAWAKKNIVGTYKNKSTGEDIIVSYKTIKKCTSESATAKSANTDIHQSILQKIPELIETALLKQTKRRPRQQRENKRDTTFL